MDADRAGDGLIAGTALEAVVFRRLAPHADRRGSFCEVFSADWGLPLQGAQWSLVHSRARVLRGMHLHRAHGEYFTVVQGRALVGLHDLRPGSPTWRRWALYALDGERPACLAFPAGLAHGWYFPTASVHLQAVSVTYDRYHPHDNRGCHFADPELGIPWPDPEPILSPRAAAFGPLSALIPAARG